MGTLTFYVSTSGVWYNQLPPGMLSAVGLPVFWFKASSSASVISGGGSGGPPSIFQA